MFKYSLLLNIFMKKAILIAILFSLTIIFSNAFAENASTVVSSTGGGQAASTPQSTISANATTAQTDIAFAPYTITVPISSIKSVGNSYEVEVPVAGPTTAGGMASPAQSIVSLPTTTSISISPTSAQAVSINEKPVEFTGVTETPTISVMIMATQTSTVESAISGGAVPSVQTPTNVMISVNEQTKTATIQVANTVAVTQETIKVEQNMLKVQTSTGDVTVGIMPAVATQAAISVQEQTVEKIELKVVENKPVYEVDGTKDVKVIGIIPASMPITTQVSAETGQVIKTETPWWSFLVI